MRKHFKVPRDITTEKNGIWESKKKNQHLKKEREMQPLTLWMRTLKPKTSWQPSLLEQRPGPLTINPLDRPQ